jgi:hypothetical protein
MDERDLKQLTEEVYVLFLVLPPSKSSLPFSRPATSSSNLDRTTTSSATTNASSTSPTTCCTSSWSTARAETLRESFSGAGRRGACCRRTSFGRTLHRSLSPFMTVTRRRTSRGSGRRSSCTGILSRRTVRPLVFLSLSNKLTLPLPSVFLDKDNNLKLGDFGLSKAMQHAAMTQTYVGVRFLSIFLLVFFTNSTLLADSLLHVS